jgi:hypothetical protein
MLFLIGSVQSVQLVTDQACQSEKQSESVSTWAREKEVEKEVDRISEQ